MKADFSQFNNDWFYPGRGIAIRVIWFVVNVVFLRNPCNPFSGLKIVLLKLFGAKIGKGVVLKPGINVKYPWHLEIGNFSWLGENTWYDTLASIKIGSNVCISQGVLMLTGNHDWSDVSFGLIVKPIIVEDGAWIGANSIVLPGSIIREHSVLTAGSVKSGSTEPRMIYSGNPAVGTKKRYIHDL